MDGRGQSGNIIVDARSQKGMNIEAAEMAVNRAYGADNKTGSKIQNLTILTPDGTVSVPRKR
jgi:filamentous hemagglutinin